MPFRSPPSVRVVLPIALGATLACASPFATDVVSYIPGSNINPDFTNPLTALGSPERVTGELVGFPGPVNPFNPPFGSDEIVSVGEGGSLTVRFDQPVINDPLNPFGIDLLIFGNSFFGISDFNDAPNGVVTGAFTEGGLVQVSADGVSFVTVPNAQADGVFPTLGFQDLVDPFASSPGLIPTDFTRPVDPALDPTGLNLAQLSLAYNGSGGGAGIDLDDVGLQSITHVRILNLDGSGVAPEIDAFADVSAIPAPATLPATLAALGLLAATRRRRHSPAARNNSERPIGAPHG
ncbi:MAG: hypothetical protein AAGK04_06260 [Planctomycetota bacterium]